MQTKLKIIAFIVLLIGNFQAVKSNKESGFYLNMGIGYFDAFNLGLKWQFKEVNRVGFSSGYDNDIFNFGKYFMLSLDYERMIFKEKTNEFGFKKWGILFKSLYWINKNQYYNWYVMGLTPAVTRHIYFNKKLFLSLEGGIQSNIVFKNERKTFQEAGWPYHFAPEFELTINYRLK